MALMGFPAKTGVDPSYLLKAAPTFLPMLPFSSNTFIPRFASYELAASLLNRAADFFSFSPYKGTHCYDFH